MYGSEPAIEAAGSRFSGPGRTLQKIFNQMRRYCVITDKCIKDMRCVAACLRKAIHPTMSETQFTEAAQLFINPARCIGCGSCISACKSGAIFEVRELPLDLRSFAEVNANYFGR